MLPSARFKLNQPQVVHETFEAEVLAINLDSGTYYSMLGMSGTVWSWLVKGASFGAVREAMLASCEGEPSVIEDELRAFVTRLQDQHLLIPDQTATGPEPSIEPLAKVPFQPLAIDVFTDMQDLLLLDPIHDVEEQGWPVAKGATRDRED